MLKNRNFIAGFAPVFSAESDQSPGAVPLTLRRLHIGVVVCCARPRCAQRGRRAGCAFPPETRTASSAYRCRALISAADRWPHRPGTSKKQMYVVSLATLIYESNPYFWRRLLHFFCTPLIYNQINVRYWVRRKICALSWYCNKWVSTELSQNLPFWSLTNG